MRVPNEAADRLAAEAMIAGADGGDGLLPALCHRLHLHECRRAVLRRAEGVVAARTEVPHA